MQNQQLRTLLILAVICFIVPVKTLQQHLIPNDSQQIYKLTNKVSIFDVRQSPKHLSEEEASYTFSALLKVNSVWSSTTEQLLQIYFNDASVKAPGKGAKKIVTQDITKIPDRPFYISLIDGKPSKVIAHTSRDQSLLNLERGIASLLQLKYENGVVSEMDVSGQCNSFYSVKSSTRIEKTKKDCSHWDLRVNYRPEKALGVLQDSEEHLTYELNGIGNLMKVESNEVHRMVLGAKSDVGSKIESQLVVKHLAIGDEVVQQLNYVTLDEAVESLLEWYRIFDIEADVDGAISEIKETTLKKLIKEHTDELMDQFIGRESITVVFAKLLPVARITKQSEFIEILQSNKQLQSQLVDLLGAVQTFDAHQAINEVFKYNNSEDFDLLEKYLQSLAIGTHPERAIIEDLLGRVNKPEEPLKFKKLHDTVIQTVASLTRQSNFDSNDPLLQSVRNFLLEELKCKGITCKTIIVRALQNLQDPITIPILLQNALEGEVKVSVTSMQALKSFPITNFKESHRKIFTDIFYQYKRKYDSSTRTLALDIILALKPTKDQLGDLLDYLVSNDRQYEVKTYVIQKLLMIAEKCPRFKALLRSCLAERPKVNNYNTIGQKGLTTAIMRQLSTTPAFNESLLSVQEMSKGVLKRGSVELILNVDGDESSTFKLGIYTNGLSSFVGDSDESEDDTDVEDSPATAGMEISVQGILLRPLIFFTGQTELMGHVWSGTASESTPAYQATTLAQDHEHYVILSSGATLYNRIIGMRSIDLNGKVTMSLWNRNANTEINQNSGYGIVGLTTVGFTYAKVSSEFTLTSEPNLSLQANLDFYSDIKLCMQLQRPEMILTHSNTKSVQLSSNRSYVKHIRNKCIHKSLGRTLALNQKNNEMCKMIFA